MFNIGGGEMLMLGVLALMVFGPEGLPGVIRSVMRTVRGLRRAAADFQNEVKTALDEEHIQSDQAKRRRKPEIVPPGDSNLPLPAPAPDGEADTNAETDTDTDTDSNTEPEAETGPSTEMAGPTAEQEPPIEENTESSDQASEVPEEQMLESEAPTEETADPSPSDDDDDDDGPSIPMTGRKRTEEDL